MNPSIVWHQVSYWLVELLTSFAVVSWIAWAWRQKPSPFVVRLMRNPQRLWLAIAFAVLPKILGMLLGWPLMWLHQSERWSFARLPVSYILTAIYGVFFGIAASCSESPSSEEDTFPRGQVFGISAALILVPVFLLSWWWSGFFPLLYVAHIAAVVAILIVARLMIGDRVASPASSPDKPAPRPLGLALLIGFTPSALLLGAVAIASAANLPKTDANSLLWFCSVVSVVCCFVSSGMLFSRKTGGAIAGAIMLMLLNAFIAFFFGCCASLKF